MVVKGNLVIGEMMTYVKWLAKTGFLLEKPISSSGWRQVAVIVVDNYDDDDDDESGGYDA